MLQRLHFATFSFDLADLAGDCKSARSKLHHWMRAHDGRQSSRPKLGFDLAAGRFDKTPRRPRENQRLNRKTSGMERPPRYGLAIRCGFR